MGSLGDYNYKWSSTCSGIVLVFGNHKMIFGKHFSEEGKRST